jgi:tRNA dimethylallyltransferase
VANQVAHVLGVRIISCDSMQLYRGLPLLTNQPSAEEPAVVEHALVGAADPDEEWTAAQYAEQATAAVDADLARRGWALIVGGTGLYLRAALAPLAIPSVHDPILRARLEERAGREGPGVLYEELRSLDPQAASRIHPRNVRRVVRALEVAIAVGPGAWSGRDDLWRPAYRHPTVIVGLSMERSLLYRRIDARARQMVAGGAVDEVRADRARRSLLPGAESRAGGRGVRKAIGYAEISAYLDGDATREQTVDRVAAATRRYARRQLTWMRKVPDAVIIDASSRTAADIAAEVLALAQAEPSASSGE